jgi:hypothetical protein
MGFISWKDVFSNGFAFCSVGDPDPEPDPQDSHVFGPPGSGSISQRYWSGSGSGSFPFLINVLSGTIPAKYNFNTKF